MAYCVRCGVKLAGGSKHCPLCNTPVLLPEGFIEEIERPLFSKPLGQAQKGGLSKARKGILELMVALGVVAFISVGLALSLSGHRDIVLIPLVAIIVALVSLSYVLMGRQTYVAQSTVHLSLSVVLLLVIDGTLGRISWSLVAAFSIALFWTVWVFPFMKHPELGVPQKLATSMVAVLFYLGGLNMVLAGKLTWFFPLALPLWAFIVTATVILLVSFASRKERTITITELVLSTLFIVFLSLTGLDLLLNHYENGVWALRWSYALLVGSVVLLLVLLAYVLSLRVRRYFTSSRTPR